MILETLATFYCIVHNESKLTYRNNQIRYDLQLNKSTIITQVCWELQIAWAINGSTQYRNSKGQHHTGILETNLAPST